MTETKTKHTPGPWKYTVWGQTISIDSIGGYCGLAHINTNGDYNNGIPDGMDVANARLIASAPTMFEALKDTLYYGVGKLPDLFLNQVKEAIEKAEGGS